MILMPPSASEDWIRRVLLVERGGARGEQELELQRLARGDAGAAVRWAGAGAQAGVGAARHDLPAMCLQQRDRLRRRVRVRAARLLQRRVPLLAVDHRHRAVARVGVAGEDLLHDLLPVDQVLHRLPDVQLAQQRPGGRVVEVRQDLGHAGGGHLGDRVALGLQRGDLPDVVQRQRPPCRAWCPSAACSSRRCRSVNGVQMTLARTGLSGPE